MKIRTDFVTNSSSSGFVVIIVNMNDGREFGYENEYDSGYGGYFWNGGDFEGAFEKAESGLDVLNAILEKTNGAEFIESGIEYDSFATELKKVDSTSEIDSIRLWEETRFGGGEFEEMDRTYRFKKKDQSMQFGQAQGEIKPISCKGKRFLLTGGAAVGNRLKNFITSRGGTLVDGAPSAVKKINYVVYIDYNSKTRKAEELRAKGNDISIIKVDDFYKAVELASPEDENAVLEGTGSEVLQNTGELGKYVCCLTGDFEFGSKEDVERYIVAKGGRCTSSVTNSTNMLIIGAKGSDRYSHGSYGQKYVKAKEMQNNGADMTILQEKEFFEKFN